MSNSTVLNNINNYTKQKKRPDLRTNRKNILKTSKIIPPLKFSNSLAN
jgi:hypothetical protein